MGLRSWIVTVKNNKKDIKKCIRNGMLSYNNFIGVIWWNEKFHLLFQGDGNCSSDAWVELGYKVFLLDNLETESNGRIVGAIYIGEPEFPNLKMNVKELKKFIKKMHKEIEIKDEDIDSS